MNLRKASDYSVGLDLGTGSVGWCAVDNDGYLYSFKRKPTWGSRIYGSAAPAADARQFRSLRRRYDRRRQRLNLLQELFSEEMYHVDPDFFIRLNQSQLLKEDRDETCKDYACPLFKTAIDEKQYYKTYPTIYHLRAALMHANQKMDLRLVYLALHNIVKYRGNFLYQEYTHLSAKDAGLSEQSSNFLTSIEHFEDDRCISFTYDTAKIIHFLNNLKPTRAQNRDEWQNLFVCEASDDIPEKQAKDITKCIAQAIFGYQADFSALFGTEKEKSKFKLSQDEKVTDFEKICPTEFLPLFNALKAMYSAYLLTTIIRGSNGGTISNSKIAQYNAYHDDLVKLKKLVKRILGKDEYDTFFQGVYYKNTKLYNKQKAEGYTAYDLGKLSYDDFVKKLRTLIEKLENSGDLSTEDAVWIKQIPSRLENEEFLRRLRTSDNGSIPYQFHFEEMDAIINNQGKYYPFLLKEKEKIESLVTFRIPYYVGPLTLKNAARDIYGNARFAWIKKKEGTEKTRILPWNWEDVVDKHATAEAFIKRMTGKCTYLYAEDVLPKCSLLYQKFCAYNELNGMRWTTDNDQYNRFSADYREGIYNDLFVMSKGKVTYKKIEHWLEQQGELYPHVKGGQGEAGLESTLSSYHFFKDLLKFDVLTAQQEKVIEKIILWNTIFEDRTILKEKLKAQSFQAEFTAAFSRVLTAEQIQKICKKRFTGWGKLSKKLLTGLYVNINGEQLSILDLLKHGDVTDGRAGRALIFQEIVTMKQFKEAIVKANEKALSTCVIGIHDLPCSPADKRTVNQALRVVDEIASIASCAPSRIFIEVTRENDTNNKGKRTDKRTSKLEMGLKKLRDHEDTKAILAELKKHKTELEAHENSDEKLMLYFAQNGKSLYSGTPLDINELSHYQVDHIIPQSYIKDDSIDNKALVLASENQRKSDSLLLDDSIRRKMSNTWNALFKAGLMSEKKLNNLKCSNITDRRLKSFINRQLVETSQICKYAMQLLKEKYPRCEIIPVKAVISSGIRHTWDIAKCREANDYHHAHDAYLACEVGRFIQLHYPKIYSNPTAYNKEVRGLIQSNIKHSASEGNGRYRLPGDSGWLTYSFAHNKTAVWDCDAERDRLLKYVDYPDCHITRMAYIETGAFWDQTLYSPHDKKPENLIPIKKNLDTHKYGGYSSKKYAFFFVYSLQGSKNNKEYHLLGLPIAKLAEATHNTTGKIDMSRLIQLEKQLITAHHAPIQIVQPIVYKNQLIEFDGRREIITGNEERRNAWELAFKQQHMRLLKMWNGDLKGKYREKKEDVDEDCLLDEMFDLILEKTSHYAPKLHKRLLDIVNANANDYSRIEMIFAAIKDQNDKKGVIFNIISNANASKNQVDLTAIGGSHDFGKIRDQPKQFDIIEQSVTGMFEKRIHIGV